MKTRVVLLTPCICLQNNNFSKLKTRLPKTVSIRAWTGNAHPAQVIRPDCFIS